MKKCKKKKRTDIQFQKPPRDGVARSPFHLCLHHGKEHENQYHFHLSGLPKRLLDLSIHKLPLPLPNTTY